MSLSVSKPMYAVDALRRAQIDREQGRGTIRSQTGPHQLECTWTECQRPARREHQHVDIEPQKNLFRFFCSDRCHRYWLNSPRDMGNLPSGSRGLVT